MRSEKNCFSKGILSNYDPSILSTYDKILCLLFYIFHFFKCCFFRSMADEEDEYYVSEEEDTKPKNPQHERFKRQV